jgi:hypothetical protein
LGWSFEVAVGILEDVMQRSFVAAAADNDLVAFVAPLCENQNFIKIIKIVIIPVSPPPPHKPQGTAVVVVVFAAVVVDGEAQLGAAVALAGTW